MEGYAKSATALAQAMETLGFNLPPRDVEVPKNFTYVPGIIILEESAFIFLS